MLHLDCVWRELLWHSKKGGCATGENQGCHEPIRVDVPSGCVPACSYQSGLERATCPLESTCVHQREASQASKDTVCLCWAGRISLTIAEHWEKEVGFDVGGWASRRHVGTSLEMAQSTPVSTGLSGPLHVERQVE